MYRDGHSFFRSVCLAVLSVSDMNNLQFSWHKKKNLVDSWHQYGVTTISHGAGGVNVIDFI